MQGTLAFKQKGGSAFMRQFTIAEGDHHNIKSGDHTHATGMSAQAVVLATVCEHKLATQQPLQRGLRAVHICMPCWINHSWAWRL